MNIFEQHIFASISAVRPDLAEIRDLTHLVDILFDANLYKAVSESLLDGQISNLPEPTLMQGSFREYLIAYSFRAGSNELYLATFYDNDALEQDPQVIEILKWKSLS